MIDPKDEAQAKIDACGIEPGQVYKHWKTRGLYVVVAVAIKEDTLEPMVSYRSNARGTTWVRTLEDFAGRADTDTEYVLAVGTKQMGKARFSRAKDRTCIDPPDDGTTDTTGATIISRT